MANKILVLGSQGYLGRPLMDYLESRGFEVQGIDNNSRKGWVNEIGGESLIPFKRHKNTVIHDITKDYDKTKALIKSLNPDTIIHLAEQPSAPFSMIDSQHATDTQRNNILGTMHILWAIKEINPEIHLIKLGTAGEYPDWLYDGIKIPEGSRIDVQYQGKDWTIPTPRYAGSFYHMSKLHDSYNIDYACRIWGLRATDINQAPVYGYLNGGRFDYDYYFGTVINRFAVQAIAGIPLTVFGEGEQMRGFIHLLNSLEAIEIVINHPPEEGEYRVIHQLTETQTINNLASIFQEMTGCEVEYLENPRAERGYNRFKFDSHFLTDRGLVPVKMIEGISKLLRDLEPYKENIIKRVIPIQSKWK